MHPYEEWTGWGTYLGTNQMKCHYHHPRTSRYGFQINSMKVTSYSARCPHSNSFQIFQLYHSEHMYMYVSLIRSNKMELFLFPVKEIIWRVGPAYCTKVYYYSTRNILNFMLTKASPISMIWFNMLHISKSFYSKTKGKQTIN